MPKDKPNLEESFNLLVQLARQQKLTWDEHLKVSEAIETVLSALNGEADSKANKTFVSHLAEDTTIDEPSDEGE